MMDTVNIDGRLALQLRCDWCGKKLGETAKYTQDLLNRAREKGWYWVGYETPDDIYPYITCHYCCEACQTKWERRHKKAERRTE